MKKNLTWTTMAFIAATLGTAQAAPKDEVKNAIAKLTEKGSYSWKSTTEAGGAGGGGGGAGRFRAGPTEGKTTKEGVTMLSMNRGENTTEAYIKGTNKGAIKTAEGWKSLAEAGENEDRQNPARFVARMLQNYKTPAVDAQELLGKVKEVKKTEEVYSGDLSEEAVKELLSRGGRRGNNTPPEATNAKGSAKFWVKDGVLSKYQFVVQGTVKANDQERNVERTTTVEIKDVGTTKVEVPEEAKKKMS